MRISFPRGAPLALTATLVLACSGTRDDTSLMVTLTQAAGVEVDQFRAQIEAGPDELWGPVLAPETATKPLRGTQTLRLLLPDTLAGNEASIEVAGLWQGEPRAWGRSTIAVRLGVETSVTVALSQAPQDPLEGGGGLDGGEEFDAGMPLLDAGFDAGVPAFDAGFDAGVPSFDAGVDAGSPACASCDRLLSDGCSAVGQCTCGTSLRCSAGQLCLAGRCVCNAASCPGGCCDGAMCRTKSAATCGNGGSACVQCSPSVADSCSASGACACGGGGPCGAGQRCVGGGCVCDATSCPNGCCAAGICRATAFATCASGGKACLACDAKVANVCAPFGACLCGTGPACGAGQRCSGGTCICDKDSCPNGCCQASVCQPGNENLACGKNGQGCDVCNGNKECRNNQCRGGD